METTTPAFNPHTLMIVPSMACHAACTYCFGPHEGKTMDTETVDAIARFAGILPAARSPRKVLFHGGEPLLAGHAWFEYTLEKLSADIEGGALFSMQSNLWSLDRRFIDLFARYGVSVGASLDGDRDVCDRQRGKGYFDRTVEGLRLMKENGLDISVIATVLPENIERLPETIRFFEREQIPFTIRGAVPSLAHGYRQRAFHIDSGDAERIYAQVFAYLEDRPQFFVRDVEAPVINAFNRHSGLCTFSNCTGMYAAIDPDGDIYTCQRFCGAKEYAVGNVFTAHSIEDITASEGYRRIAAKYGEAARGQCRDCRHWTYCNGGCVYGMMVAEKYGRPHPFCNAGEKPAFFYRKLFDEVQIKLAGEVADRLLKKDSPTPYLGMAGDRPHPATERYNRRLVLKAGEWAKTGAPRYAFAFRQTAENLYLNITNNCPLRCRHCSVEATSGNRDMPLDTVVKVIGEAVDTGYKEVSLNGGEPFVYGDFEALLDRMGEMKHPRTRFALFTNLYCDFTDALAAKALEVFDAITVSLDGDRDEHDARRGKGSFDRTCANIRRLVAMQAQDCKLSVRATLTPEQKRRGVHDSVRGIARELGVESVYITRAYPIGRAKDLESIYDIDRPGDDGTFFKKPFRPRNSCGIGKNLHVTPEGNAYPCWAVMDISAPMGNVGDGLKKITANYRRFNNRDYTVDARKKCKECEVRYICGGICYALSEADCSRLKNFFLDKLGECLPVEAEQKADIFVIARKLLNRFGKKKEI
jgi:uncharacterized protein